MPSSGFDARSLAAALAAANPPVIVRDHETERGHFQLDPCNLHPGEAEIVARTVVTIVRASNTARFANVRREDALARLLRWPD